jgi:hypothetical protein
MLGEMFEGRARTQSTFASTVVTVMTVLLILFGLGMVVFGIVGPMYTLISRLSG